jgi:DNA-binding response OmpR family regulator
MDEKYFIRKPIAMDDLVDRIKSIISSSEEMTNMTVHNNKVAHMQEK